MNTSDLTLFVRTADSGNITRAATKLGISPASASAALKRLEKQLETTLFVRSTRQLRLTAEGEGFLLYCRNALDTLDEGIASLSAMKGKVAGEIRFAVSSDLGRNIVLPWLDETLEQHPELSLNLSLSDTLSDFYLDRVDLALRYGEPEDSNLVAFHIATVDRVAFASPHYLARYGTPVHPDQLQKHNCLLYRIGNRTYNSWVFSQRGERIKVQVGGNRESNDADIVRRWAVSGHGIAYKSSLDISTELREGRVIKLFPDFETPPLNVWLICPGRKQITPATLLLRELLREKCAQVLADI
ncbi:MAG: LysR family transcriptional regulator [Marinobacterium sp.]|nr:LysR family transcriptional regulator [Marinobacterium sp.]